MKELTLPGTLRRFAPAGRLIACMALALLLKRLWHLCTEERVLRIASTETYM